MLFILFSIIFSLLLIITEQLTYKLANKVRRNRDIKAYEALRQQLMMITVPDGTDGWNETKAFIDSLPMKD